MSLLDLPHSPSTVVLLANCLTVSECAWTMFENNDPAAQSIQLGLYFLRNSVKMWSRSCSIKGDNLENHVLAAPLRQSKKAVGRKSCGQEEIVAVSL